MPELYLKLVAGGAQIHFVSSSPWQLYDPLREFFVEAGFPWATLDLKSMRFRDDTFFNLFKKGTETKPEQIVPILERYSARKFILIGDNGEQDPEVYGEIARQFADSIRRILIRNINNSKAEDARYLKAFNGVPSSKWQLFDKPEQLSARELLQTAQ